MLDWLLNNGYAALLLWIVLYCLDYIFTIWQARLYQAGVERHIHYENGIELTPFHRRDVSRLRWISPRFLALLALTSLFIWLAWLLSYRWSYDPRFFEFILGAWVLLESCVHVRHFRGLFHFCYLKNSQGVEGSLKYASWLSYRMSSVDLLAFTGLYLFIYILTGRVFFLAGAAACAATAIFHWVLGSRAKRARRQAVGGV